MSKSTITTPAPAVPTSTVAQTSALAALMGEAAGQAAAGWVFDGNTTAETYRKVLDALQSGDPVIDSLVTVPTWLSGEHADSMTPAALLASLDATEVEDADADAICTAYETAADETFWDHVTKAAMDATA